MAQIQYKVRLNSSEKIEELLQEIYDQSCKQMNEIQNELNKLVNSTNMASEDFTMDDKAKYFKAVHDLTQDKKQALATKIEIAKFMGEILKYNGNAKAAIEDKGFQKRTALNLSSLKAALADDGTDGETENYTLRDSTKR